MYQNGVLCSILMQVLGCDLNILKLDILYSSQTVWFFFDFIICDKIIQTNLFADTSTCLAEYF